MADMLGIWSAIDTLCYIINRAYLNVELIGGYVHVRIRKEFTLCKIKEAPLGVIGIRNIWVKNYKDTGYLGGKLRGYGIL